MPVSLYIDTVFAVGGDVTVVPDATDPSGFVSFYQGYTSDYELPPSDPSYKEIERNKFNYIINQITGALQFMQQNCTPFFITSAMNGGSPYSYSQNDRVLSSGVVYQSTADSNTQTPPDTKWKKVYQGGTFQTGMIMHNISSTPFLGFLNINGDSIGSAGSGATHADDSLYNLYALWWNNVSFPSANIVAPVTGGLGANAAADFAANKKLTMPDSANRAIIGVGSFLTQSGSVGGAMASAGSIAINSVTLSASNSPVLSYTLSSLGSSSGSSPTVYFQSAPALTTNQTHTGAVSTNAGGSSFTPTGSFTGSANGNYMPVIAGYANIAI